MKELDPFKLPRRKNNRISEKKLYHYHYNPYWDENILIKKESDN